MQGFGGKITAAAGFFFREKQGPVLFVGGGDFPKSSKMSETFRKFAHFSETRPLTGCGRVLE